MKRTVNYLAIAVGLLAGAALSPTVARALSITDYESPVPFISDTVPPNILLLMDNSGSMADRACDSTNCGVHADGTTTPVVTTFVATTTYTGFFAPLGCYTYNSTDKRFELSTLRASLSTTCSSTAWDGNFLNWITFRRFDAVKKAFTGGDCAVARNADGTCPASGSPALKTVKGQSTFPNTSAGNQETGAVPSTGANSYVGRIPDTVAKGGNSSLSANLYFHVRGGTSGMGGTFCVDNDSSAASNTATTCLDTETRGVIAFVETQRTIAVGLTTEPTGVIQQVGSKARFGLLEFKGAGDGGRVLTGLGSRQSIGFNSTTVSTFNSNTAAILDAIGKSFPSTWTPLSESLYDGVRYIAQINSEYVPSSYTYPIAFSDSTSGGVTFQATGAGSIGSSEITALTGSETCPSGYITNACGRDPYFYGSNHTPKWASTSSLVKCCKTFIMILTDGEPTQDTNIPSALQDYGHAAHGTHCTGG
nr:hypothetical protein [Nitrospirota bacterium]